MYCHAWGYLFDTRCSVGYGARWYRDFQCLAEPHKGQLYDTMPVIHFIPHVDLKKAMLWEYDDFGPYLCPTYKTSTRSGLLSTTGMSTNYIAPISLPTPEDNSKPPSYWVCQGVAMLCALND